MSKCSPVEERNNEVIGDFSAQIYDKRINFLIGSGASAGALPTLSTNFTKDGEEISFEKLACDLENENYQALEQLLFYEIYCKTIIQPSYEMDYSKASKSVLNNYSAFFSYILSLLSIKKSGDTKRCNIFSTNYDLFMESAADELIQKNDVFVLNDGSDGFRKKVLRASNFNKQVSNTGVFDRFISEIPMLNLIKLHGSVSWKKESDDIIVDYNKKSLPFKLPVLSQNYINNETTYEDLLKISIKDEDKQKLSDFWTYYHTIPIVNPTKWKFNETVFEQHYYQMLRLFSYELEKKDAFLVTFGFSFRDEHIYDLVRRSLMNPTLSVFIFCYDKAALEEMRFKFSAYKNVFYIYKHKAGDEKEVETLDFTDFNKILRNELSDDVWAVIR